MVKQLSGLEQTPITNKTNNLCCSFYETPQNPFLFILTTLLFCHIYFIVLTLILSSYTRVDLYCFSWVALWAAFVFINKAYYPNNYMMSVHSDQQEWDMQRLGLRPRVEVWEIGWVGVWDGGGGHTIILSPLLEGSPWGAPPPTQQQQHHHHHHQRYDAPSSSSHTFLT